MERVEEVEEEVEESFGTRENQPEVRRDIISWKAEDDKEWMNSTYKI